MTEQSLKNLEQLLNQQNFGVLSEEEYTDIRFQVKNDLRGCQLKNFVAALKAKLPDGQNSTEEEQAAYDEAFEQFYDTDWHIQFGELNITISNEAIIYNGICDTLQELITEYNL